MTNRVGLAIGFALVASSARAQCSLCRFAVEQDASLGAAFNKAIILLLVPALAVFAGVFIIALRSSEAPRESATKPTRE
jgi:hypothetical protein